MSSKTAKMAAKTSMLAQDGPDGASNMAPEEPEKSRRLLRSVAPTAQESPRSLQNRPWGLQDGSRKVQEAPKSAPRGLQDNF
eukprot:307977-Pyramimonas_sp.AAC.1